jgi:hypothetical protein
MTSPPTSRFAPALAAALAVLALRCGSAPQPPPAAAVVRVAAPQADAAAPRPEVHGPRRDPTRAEFAFAIDAGDEMAIVLADDLEPFRLLGEPELVTSADADPLILRQAVLERSLPDDVLAFRGQAVTLYDRERPVCEGGVVGFAAVGRLHQPGIDWAGNRREGPPASRQEIAADAWSMSSQAIVALVRTSSPCAGARWGRLSSLPPPRFAEVERAKGALADRAIDAFRALPGYAESQRLFEEEQARARENGFEALDSRWDGGGASMDIVRIPWSGRTLLRRSARVGEACGFRTSLEAIWEASDGEGGPSLRLLQSGEAGSDVELLLDANGDGHLEGVLEDEGSDHSELVPWPEGGDALRAVSLPSNGCPC